MPVPLGRRMMGHRERLISGAEYDYLIRRGRRLARPKVGRFTRMKRAFNKRVRRAARLAVSGVAKP